MFIAGLFIIKMKAKKRRILNFFPAAALTIFILAAEYNTRYVNVEILRDLLHFLTTRSYPVFCLFLAFVAGNAVGEIILFINKRRMSLYAVLKSRIRKRNVFNLLHGSLVILSHLVVLVFSVYFVMVTINYMVSFKGQIKTEAATSSLQKPSMIMEAIQWLDKNADERDLVMQLYSLFPITDMSGSGNIMSIQEHTGLPVFGGGHFESSAATMLIGDYDKPEYFNRHSADQLHASMTKFNVKYIVADNGQPFISKLTGPKGFERVFNNRFLTILKIRGVNDFYIARPEKSNIKVLSHELNVDTVNPRLSWTIDNGQAYNTMNLSITYFPKWKATIDGDEIQIQKTPDFMMSIPLVDSGRQTVTFEYRTGFPEIFFNYVSLLTFLLIIAFFIWNVILGRKEIAWFHPDFWKTEFHGKALKKKIFLVSVAVSGAVMVILSLAVGLGDITLARAPSTGAELIDYDSMAWRFSFEEGSSKGVLIPRLELMPDKSVRADVPHSEDHWGIENGYLVFYNGNNAATTRFTQIEMKDGKYILKGPFLFKQSVTHILEQVD